MCSSDLIPPSSSLALCPSDQHHYTTWLQSWFDIHPLATPFTLLDALLADNSLLYSCWVPWDLSRHPDIPSDGYCGYTAHWYITQDPLPPLPITLDSSTRRSLTSSLDSTRFLLPAHTPADFRSALSTTSSTSTVMPPLSPAPTGWRTTGFRS